MLRSLKISSEVGTIAIGWNEVVCERPGYPLPFRVQSTCFQRVMTGDGLLNYLFSIICVKNTLNQIFGRSYHLRETALSHIADHRGGRGV